MREVAKSFLSFSWAMSLLGLEQLGNLVGTERKSKENENITGALDSVTEAAGEQFGERTKTVFESGNQLQQEMLDMAFDLFKADYAKPEQVIRRAADVVEKSANALRKTVPSKEPSRTRKKSR